MSASASTFLKYIVYQPSEIDNALMMMIMIFKASSKLLRKKNKKKKASHDVEIYRAEIFVKNKLS